MRKHVRRLLVASMLITTAMPGNALPRPVAYDDGSRPALANGGGPAEASPSALVEFDDCADFLDHVKSEALERVGPYGFGRDPFLALEELEEAVMVAEDAAAGATSPVAGIDYSTTNVQEIGVDEPDLVKTDGRRILALAQGVLYYIDVSGDAPELVSTYDLWPWTNRFGGGWVLPEHQIFLSGDTALLLMTGDGYVPGGLPESRTVAVRFDLSEPVVLRVEMSLTVDGRLVSARMVDDRVALVVSFSPRIEREFVHPASGKEPAARRAEEANRMAIQESTLEHWAPGYEVRVRNTWDPDRGRLIDCSSTYAPREFSGFDLLSVLTFDVSGEIDTGRVATVMSGGDTVYASTDRLYVANRRRLDRNDFDAANAGGISTHIHRFDIGGADGPVYEASGAVDGFLLNQFAMSEHDGYLRVASTDAPVWAWWDRDRTSDSRVDVLRRDGSRLRVAGSVGGLGKGERIFAVRFIGEVGYVVTFREVDPLYTIDLSDPTDPKVVGELKIPGYSAYLHPIGEDLLLGVGQDADQQGRVMGTQLSLFDVSDPAKPLRTHQFKLPRASTTEVEFNHRAFLYWPGTGLAVLPVGWWGDREGSGEWESYQGAIAFDVGPDGIERLGAIEHRFDPGNPEAEAGTYGWTQASIRRSLVIGRTLFTMSDAGLKGSDLASLSDTSWTRFPFRPYGY